MATNKGLTDGLTENKQTDASESDENFAENEISISAKASQFVDADFEDAENDRDEKLEVDMEEDYRCGWFGYKPQFLQRFNRAGGFLFVVCVFGLAQSTTVNGLVYVTTTTLEKRFRLTSARSGSISSMYDAGVLIVIIFVSYLGETARKPLWIGIGALIYSSGSMLFVLPHFLTDNYKYGTSLADDTCNPNKTVVDECTIDDAENLSSYYWFFVCAQLLHGFGASPLYTQGQAYIYLNTHPSSASLFIAIFQAVTAFAPAVGYIVGGIFLSMYTDLRVADEQKITNKSPLWVGNWWLGFLCTGTLALLAALPLTAFPKHIPGAKQFERQISSVQRGKIFKRSGKGFKATLKDFPRSIGLLLTNIPFMCANVAFGAELFIISSLAIFGPKLIESQFSLSTSEAAIVVGLLLVPSALGGTIGGGYLIKLFKLQFLGKARLVAGLLGSSGVMMVILIFHCPNIPFAGVTYDYSLTNELKIGESNLTSICNFDCKCSEEYDPVCGRDEIIYYNGCYAGCNLMDYSTRTKEFSNCSCISPSTDDISNGLTGGAASQGRCEGPECNLQAPFFSILFFAMLFTFTAIVPAVTACMAVVDPTQVPTALGINSVFYRCLGTIPAPIIFGYLVDQACMVWQEECEGLRTCWQYDNKEFALITFYVLFTCRALSTSLFVCALLFYKKPLPDKDEDKNQVDHGNKNLSATVQTCEKGVGTID